jgi:hypothetical protein
MTQPGPTATDAAANEQRVLDELEQLQLAIRATREKRVRVQADFDAHLRAFEPPRLERVSPLALPEAARPALPAVQAPTLVLYPNLRAYRCAADFGLGQHRPRSGAARSAPSRRREGRTRRGASTPAHSRRSRVLQLPSRSP